ncbi:MAG: flagellar assembly peptidoglycan hydrolase FlgJ [Burkholderiales bacterium]
MNDAIDSAGKFYLDTHGLDALRLQAKQNPNQALSQVSRQFEAVFMEMMLKSMRDATPQDGPFDSEQTKMYTSMLDQQIAQTLAKKGIGLADIMTKQLSRSTVAQHVNPPQQPMPQQISWATAPQAEAPSTDAASTMAGSAQGRDFISKLLPHAREAARKTGIPAKFMLGQAALETGWGKHEIKSANGRPSHNLFGIKADKHWKGPVVTAPTTEYVNGMPRKVYQNFRAYHSYAESFQDYAHMLAHDPRYAPVVASGQDAAGFAQGLQSAGYATDPHYSDKLMRIFSVNALQTVA